MKHTNIIPFAAAAAAAPSAPAMTELEAIRARRVAAEDTHGRVFASVCAVLRHDDRSRELVNGWLASYRQMEALRKQERELIEHGRILGVDGPGDGHLPERIEG